MPGFCRACTRQCPAMLRQCTTQQCSLTSRTSSPRATISKARHRKGEPLAPQGGGTVKTRSHVLINNHIVSPPDFLNLEVRKFAYKGTERIIFLLQEDSN